MQLTLSKAAQLMKGALRGNDGHFSSVSLDTRTIEKGELFFAVKGNNFDGHNFIGTAAEKGAAGVVIDENSDLDFEPATNIRVPDVRKSLSVLSTYWREQFLCPVVAITGSNGKTTVKEMLSAIMCQIGNVVSTFGNQNNDLGVPLTLMRLNQGTDFGIVEMGANHPGEIGDLSQITKPSIAIITNVAEAHLKGFGSLDGVAQAKSEIFSGLASTGLAIINADDQYIDLWRSRLVSFQSYEFSMTRKADFYVTNIECCADGSSFVLNTPAGNILIDLDLIGPHNIMNALAASAAAFSLGVSLEKIKEGLQKVRAVSGRLESIKVCRHISLIDDTYNANPGSVDVAIDALVSQGADLSVLVVGDMGELGDFSEQLHQRIGESSKIKGIDYVFACGKYARLTAESFGEGGSFFDDKVFLSTALHSMITANKAQNIAVLVKGSRSMKMEEIVERLVKCL